MNPGRRVAEGSTPLADQLPLPVGVGGQPDAVRRLKRRPDRRQLRRLSPAWHHTARRAAAVPSAETISTTSTAAARIGEIVSTVRLSAVDDHLDPVNFWGELTFLDIIRPNLGWPSWEDWFQVVGRPQASSRYRVFDNYAYLLQAAGAGGGIALGWKYFIEHDLEDGTLIPLTDDLVEFRNRYCGYLTERGRSRAIAHRCLSFFGQCA